MDHLAERYETVYDDAIRMTRGGTLMARPVLNKFRRIR